MLAAGGYQGIAEPSDTGHMDVPRRRVEHLAGTVGSRWLVALVLPLALAACGGSDTTSSGVSPVAATTPQAALSAATPKDLVLASGDLGDGWTLVPSETKAISLSQAVKDDPAPLLKIERPAYRSGYQATFTNVQNDGAGSQIYRYADPTVARSIYELGVRYRPVIDPGFKPMKAPEGAPAGVAMYRGTDKAKDGSKLPIYAAMWLRGRDIGVVVVVGKGTSPLLLALLVRRQDQRMAAAATAGV
jgi:hypothetical protein